MKNKLQIRLITALFILFSFSFSFAQSDDSAIMNVESTEKGILIPRMTTTQRNNIVNPAIGLQVFDKTLNIFMFFNGNSWVSLQGATGAKGDKGDTGAQGATGDSHWLKNGTNTYYNEGSVGIGTNNPGAGLHISTLNLNTPIALRIGSGGDIVFDAPNIIGGRFIVKENGNIGIGTTNPLKPLHVKGEGGVLNIESATHGYIQFYPDGASAGRKAWLGYGGANTNDFAITNEISSGSVKFIAGGQERLNILANGNVGIGTTNPNGKLDIKFQKGSVEFFENSSKPKYLGMNIGNNTENDARSQLKFYHGGIAQSQIYTSYSTEKNFSNLIVRTLSPEGDIIFSPNSKVKLFIDASNGRMGVNTTTPAQQLQVVGQARIGVSHSEWTEIGHGGTHGFINTQGDGNLEFRHDGSTKMLLASSGNVGIGTTNPTNKLQVDNGNVRINNGVFTVSEPGDATGVVAITSPSGVPGLIFRSNVPETYRADIKRTKESLAFGVGQSTSGPSVKMKIMNDGKVIIGSTTTPGDYKLYVENGILTERVRVALETSARWADNAFGKKPSLKKMEKHIEKKSHLIGVPSAKELVENGIDVAEMDATLLRQIEWLWEYAIESEKEKQALKEEVNQLSKRLEKLESKEN